MALYYTSNTLIESIKQKAAVPTNQATFTNARFLTMANEELIIGLVPSVLQLHEDYFLYEETVALVANQSEYAIPYRAIGNKLRDVEFLDTNNNRFSMTRVSIGDTPTFQGPVRNTSPYTYAVVNNRIRILPSMGEAPTGSLVFTYYIRPSEIVAEERIGIITEINRTTGVISLSNFPENFSLSILMDFYQVQSPHRPLIIDIQPTAVDSTSLTVTFDLDDIPSQLVVGDHLAQAYECMIPQIPSDLHIVLIHRVAEQVLESQGDTEGLQNAKAKIAEMEIKTGTLIDDRVEESPMKAVNKYSALQSGRWGRRRRHSTF